MRGRRPVLVALGVVAFVLSGVSAAPAALQEEPTAPGSSDAEIVETGSASSGQAGTLPPCSADVAPTGGDTGLIVVTTEPRVAGLRVIVDGVSFSTDGEGCLVREVAVGDHVVSLPLDSSGRRRQVVGGSVRPTRARWSGPVPVGQTPAELRIIVGPPVCAFQPQQEVPRALRPGDDPSLLVIETVPRLQGALVVVDDHEFTTDEEGCLVIELERGEHMIAVPDVHEVDATTRYVFGRWDDIWAPVRPISLGSRPTEMQLGIKVQHPVRIDFVDASLDLVDLERIQTARIVNSFGVVSALSEKATEEDEAVSFDAVWLTANRLRRISAGLFSDDNIYVFREVTVDGINVVQSGEIDYVPELTPICPSLSSEAVQRCNRWTVRLLLFPFEVELRSFIFRQPVNGHVAVHLLDGPAATIPLLESRASEDGWVTWPQVPRGDYEIQVTVGGITTRSPTIVTGPKVERITVMTSDFVYFLIPVFLLLVFTVVLGIVRPKWRLALAAIWPLVIGFVLSVPNLGAAVSRPLSATATPTYSDDGAFVGISTRVNNKAPIPIEQSYCAPDFELRVPTDDGIWRATFESHDFHDVEMSRFCRIHNVDPGTSRQLFTSTEGQEWVLEGDLPPPGVYEAFVRVFGVPAGTFDLDLRGGLAPYLTFGQAERGEEAEVPFTNPFED